MADTTIKQRIALDGDSEIKKSLADIGDVGEKSGKKIEDAMKKASEVSKAAAASVQAASAQVASIGGGSGGGGSAIESAAKRAGTSVEEFQARTERFRASLAQVAPAAAVAGGGIGNLATAFALLARGVGAVGGIGAVVAAATAGAVKLAKAAEDVERAKRRIAASGGSGQASPGLNAEAEKLGTDAASQQPALEKFLQYRRKLQAENIPLREPMSPEDPRAAWAQGQLGLPLIPSEKIFLGAQGALSAAIRSDVKDPKAAAQLQHSFFSDLIDKGTLSPENIKNLETSSPTGAAALAKSLSGAAFSSGGHAGSFTNPEQLLKSLSLGNEFDVRGVLGGLDKNAAGIHSDAEGARGVSQAFEALSAATGRLTEKFSGDHVGITKGVDGLARGIDRVASGLPSSEGRPESPTAAPAYSNIAVPPLFDFLKQAVKTQAPPVILQPPRDDRSEVPEAAKTAAAGNAGTDAIKENTESNAGWFAKIVEGLSALAAKSPGQSSDGATSVLGVRGAEGGFVRRLFSKLAGGGHVFMRPFDNGGHIRGPGTGTSDSIPAMLSDGEFVVKASTVSKLGVDRLNRLNQNPEHFAGGGPVNSETDSSSWTDSQGHHHSISTTRDSNGRRTSTDTESWTDAKGEQHSVTHNSDNSDSYESESSADTKSGSDFRGSLSVTYDPNTGGAYVNGNLYPPGSPILNDPRIKAAIERSKADMDDKSSDTKSGSDFTGFFGGSPGNFAKGGLVGDAPVKLASDHLTQMFPAFFQDGGLAARLSDHAGGGFADHISPSAMPDMQTAPDLGKSHGALHPVTLHLPSGESIDGVHATPDAVSQLRTAANKAKRFSTGSKPSWYGA
jgi:hypothetical protein